MTKRRQKKANGVESDGSVEGAVGQFAEDIGNLIGEAQNKAESWLGQRTTILKNLNSLRDTVNGLISRLAGGDDAGKAVNARRGPRKAAGSDAGSGRKRKTEDGGAVEGNAVKKRRKISAAGRKAISDAQKARWARMKKEAT